MAENDNQTRLFPGLSKQIREQSQNDEVKVWEAEKQEPELKDVSLDEFFNGQEKPNSDAEELPPEAQKSEEPAPDEPKRQARVLPFRPKEEKRQHWWDDAEKRRAVFRSIGIGAVVILLLAVIVAGIIWGASTDFDALRRSYRYRGVERDERGVTQAHSLPTEGGLVGAMNRWTVQASKLGLQVQDEDGTLQASCVATLNDPALCASRQAAVAYDAGGTTLCVVNTSMQTKVVTTNAALMSVDVSENGGFCSLTASDTDKSVLTVYSENFTEIFSWYSKTRYLQTAVLSDNDETIAAVGVWSRDGAFWSSLLLLRTDSDVPVADVDLEERLVLWADWIGNVCCLVCRDGILFYSEKGELLGSYALDDRMVTGAASGDGFVALSLSEGRTGDRDALLTIKLDGTLRGELALGHAAEELSAAGKYIAVRTPQGVQVYTERLKLYSELTELGDLQSCCVRTDGSVQIAGGQGVALYLP